MAPTTMRAGYSEGSNTRLRPYGHAAAWTDTPPTSSPPTSPEPSGRPESAGRQVLTALRASLGDRRAAEAAVQEAFRRCSQPGTQNAWPGRGRPGPAVPTRVHCGTLPDGNQRNAGDAT